MSDSHTHLNERAASITANSAPTPGYKELQSSMVQAPSYDFEKSQEAQRRHHRRQLCKEQTQQRRMTAVHISVELLKSSEPSVEDFLKYAEAVYQFLKTGKGPSV